MPDIADYDNEEEWMAACVPARIEEGDEQDQAVAVCLDMWREGKGNALKAIRRTDETLRVANYIVLFGGRDLEGIASDNKNADGSTGEYFTPETDLESEYTKSGVLFVDWEHGNDDAPGPGDVLGVVDWKTVHKDTRGVWVERVLNRRNEYVKFLEDLIDQGLIGTSSAIVGSQ